MLYFLCNAKIYLHPNLQPLHHEGRWKTRKSQSVRVKKRSLGLSFISKICISTTTMVGSSQFRYFFNNTSNSYVYYLHHCSLSHVLISSINQIWQQGRRHKNNDNNNKREKHRRFLLLFHIIMVNVIIISTRITSFLHIYVGKQSTCGLSSNHKLL